MNTDLYMVMGLVLCLLAVPSLLSALVDGRPPRAAAITAMIGLGLVGIAIGNRPGGYALRDIPEAFYHVAGDILMRWR